MYVLKKRARVRFRRTWSDSRFHKRRRFLRSQTRLVHTIIAGEESKRERMEKAGLKSMETGRGQRKIVTALCILA